VLQHEPFNLRPAAIESAIRLLDRGNSVAAAVAATPQNEKPACWRGFLMTALVAGRAAVIGNARHDFRCLSF